jgi:hypothetical protein
MEEDVVVRKPGERAMRDFRCPRAEHPRADVERDHLSVAGLEYAVRRATLCERLGRRL